MNITNSNFPDLGIAPKLIQILDKNNYKNPTPIQLKSIPIAIEGKDLMGIAQTGTGKTLAFGIPMIQRLAQTSGQKKGLVLLPTRELALQVDANLKKLGQPLGLKTAVLIGGEPMNKQIRALKQDPHIIVATPGRLNDHLENTRLSLQNVSILVLDEADHMLDMGFAPQIKKILDRVPKQRQTMLFSATMPDEIVKLANTYMQLPLRVEVAPPGTAVNTVTHELYFIDRSQKNSLLKNILTEYKGSVLIFLKTKHKVKDVTRTIRNMGHSVSEIHSNRSQSQRREALDGFKRGKYRVLVATDIAARGIDVSGIQLVINYDLPMTAEDYVHRIGRTGRAGMAGHAISFASPDQRFDVRKIERLIKKTLSVAKTPMDLPKVQPERKSFSRPVAGRSDFGHSPKRTEFRQSPRPQRGQQRHDKPKRKSGHFQGSGNQDYGYFLQPRKNSNKDY
ncbi:MAG: DEAD/DEAH box helicase [Candidatus Doudnabacteria bacterium]|nr:DEAD/DEAH box helicase [Candidatus Doudnabacteria bacterium]